VFAYVVGGRGSFPSDVMLFNHDVNDGFGQCNPFIFLILHLFIFFLPLDIYETAAGFSISKVQSNSSPSRHLQDEHKISR
jgi:hypothetical protein